MKSNPALPGKSHWKPIGKNPSNRDCCPNQLLIGSEDVHWLANDHSEFAIYAECKACGTQFRRRFRAPNGDPWHDTVCKCSHPQEKFPRAEFNKDLSRAMVHRTCANCDRRLEKNDHAWEGVIFEMNNIEVKVP